MKIYNNRFFMKSALTLCLVFVLLLTSTGFSLKEGTTLFMRKVDYDELVETLPHKYALKYMLIGEYKGEKRAAAEFEEVKTDYENQITELEQQITDLDNEIVTLKSVYSDDYENYAHWFYSMSEDQFLEFCAVVQAEGGSYQNQIAITQTAINLALAFGKTPYYWMCQSGAYTYPTTNPLLQSTINNVMAVFLDGARVTSRPIKYFYSYTMMPEGSEWHENQVYVMTIDDHNFYE